MAAKKRRKRRTSIRTAAGVAQDKFLDRMRALADDPHRVLPICPHGEPKPIAKVRTGIDKLAQGKIGFLAKRDKGIVGAVANSLPLAKLEAMPRMLDTKIAGKRRFFVQRGHVARSCMVGVQNHDDPRALLMAYRPMAKDQGLHFFASDHVTCTGSEPAPPEDWIGTLADDVEATANRTEDGWLLGNAGHGHVRLGFRGGPIVDIDPRAVKGHVHQVMAARYAGPRQRHPFTIHVVLPDDSLAEPERDAVASYRAGVIDERRLADGVLAAWRKDVRHGDAVRFVIGDDDYGADQERFMAALDMEPWEIEPIRAMTATGYVGRSARTADIFQRKRSELAKALGSLEDLDGFIARHQNSTARDIVRLGLAEIDASAREAVLPRIDGGPETRTIDRIARQYRRDPRNVRAAIVAGLESKMASGHAAAFALAVGDKTLADQWSADDLETAAVLQEPAQAVLDADGADYIDAVRAFLAAAGSAERVSA